jgi:hypothetical protein
VFSWSGATGIGYLQISTSGADTITLTTSQKSGTFSVHNSFTQGVTAGAQLRSTLDKSGNSAVLASAETPAGGC